MGMDYYKEGLISLDTIIKSLKNQLKEVRTSKRDSFEYDDITNAFDTLKELQINVDKAISKRVYELASLLSEYEDFNKHSSQEELLHKYSTLLNRLSVDKNEQLNVFNKSLSLNDSSRVKKKSLNYWDSLLVYELLRKHNFIQFDWSYTNDYNKLLGLLVGQKDANEIYKRKSEVKEIVERKELPRNVKAQRKSKVLNILETFKKLRLSEGDKIEPIIKELDMILIYLDE